MTRTDVGAVTAEVMTGLIELRGVALEGVDLSHARLPSLRVFDSKIAESRFDGAHLGDFRVWNVEVARTSFRGANLRHAVLGAWDDGRGNVYTQVDFTGADLRGLVSPAATYIDCDFSEARLDGIDFQSSAFTRCRFAGELRDVIFWDHGFRTGKPDPNRMEDVDFTDAVLRFVEFRRLDLDRVKFPTSAEHLVVNGYRCVLECALASLEEERSVSGRRARALIEHRLKWCGSNQGVGVFHSEELGETPEDTAVVRDLLRQCEATCAEP